MLTSLFCQLLITNSCFSRFHFLLSLIQWSNPFVRNQCPFFFSYKSLPHCPPNIQLQSSLNSIITFCLFTEINGNEMWYKIPSLQMVSIVVYASELFRLWNHFNLLGLIFEFLKRSFCRSMNLRSCSLNSFLISGVNLMLPNFQQARSIYKLSSAIISFTMV